MEWYMGKYICFLFDVVFIIVFDDLWIESLVI